VRIFLDTNIFLDLILKRPAYKDALTIFDAVEQGLVEAVIADITILNIDYIARKQVVDIRKFLTLLNTLFVVVGASNSAIGEALNIKNNDLEDNLQYILAKSSNCSVIVTNDKKFFQGEVPLLNSQEFVERYLIGIR